MRTCTTCFLLFWYGLAIGQQTPYLKFFQQNWTMINPAAVDKSFIFQEQNPFILHAAYREQWIGLEGNPRLIFTGFEHQPAGGENYKWGFQVFSDQAGTLSTYGGYFNYAYGIPLDRRRSHRLFIGMNGGLVRYGLNWRNLQLKDPNDPLDLIIKDVVYLDFNLGIFYQAGEKFYAGLSTPKSIFWQNTQIQSEERVKTNIVPVVYFIGGAFLGQPDQVLFEPSIWIRYSEGANYYTWFDQAPVSMDFNLRTYFRDRFWLGIGAGTNSQLSVDIGINKTLPGILGDTSDRLRIGMGYNIPVATNLLNLGHSLELSISYSWH